MPDIGKLLKGTVEELDRLLDAKNVLGNPIEKDGATIVPLVSFGFGFGAGGGADSKKGDSEGTGGGGGIKPVGAIIIDANGVRVESVRGSMTSIAEIISEAASNAVARKADDTDNKPG